MSNRKTQALINSVAAKRASFLESFFESFHLDLDKTKDEIQSLFEKLSQKIEESCHQHVQSLNLSHPKKYISDTDETDDSGWWWSEGNDVFFVIL